MFKDLPILFVSLSNSDDGFTESKKHFEESRVISNLKTLRDRLVRLGTFTCYFQLLLTTLMFLVFRLFE